MSTQTTKKKKKTNHMHPITLAAVAQAFREQVQTTVGDTPPDTGSTGTQSDLINKTDEGFENYLGGAWKEGYPR